MKKVCLLFLWVLFTSHISHEAEGRVVSIGRDGSLMPDISKEMDETDREDLETLVGLEAALEEVELALATAEEDQDGGMSIAASTVAVFFMAELALAAAAKYKIPGYGVKFRMQAMKESLAVLFTRGSAVINNPPKASPIEKFLSEIFVRSFGAYNFAEILTVTGTAGYYFITSANIAKLKVRIESLKSKIAARKEEISTLLDRPFRENR